MPPPPRGSTLLEVLISLSLLAFVLLATLTLSHLASQARLNTAFHQSAARQIQNLKARLSLTSEDFTDAHLAIWRQQNTQLLPQPQAELNPHSIRLCWGSTGDHHGCLEASR